MIQKVQASGYFKVSDVSGSYYEALEAVELDRSDVILEIDKSFPYPHSFASNLFEMANNQIYFALHLPKLTDLKVKEDDYHEVVSLLKFYVKQMLSK